LLINKDDSFVKLMKECQTTIELSKENQLPLALRAKFINVKELKNLVQLLYIGYYFLHCFSIELFTIYLFVSLFV
jgi:ABC-type iron transport system FetAB permease component